MYQVGCRAQLFCGGIPVEAFLHTFASYVNTPVVLEKIVTVPNVNSRITGFNLVELYILSMVKH